MLRTHDEIVSFYREVFEEHGAVPAGMAWMNAAEHYDRIRLAAKLLHATRGSIPNRILEVGCGYGILPMLWKGDGELISEYTGVDVTPDVLDHARFLFYKEPGFVFLNEPFEDTAIGHPYGLTIAIGVIAWQPEAVAWNILTKMWDATDDGGALLFTYLPGEPLNPGVIKILRSQLGVNRWCEYTGYCKSGEHMVIFIKKGEIDDLEDREREMAVAIARAEEDDELQEDEGQVWH